MENKNEFVEHSDNICKIVNLPSLCKKKFPLINRFLCGRQLKYRNTTMIIIITCLASWSRTKVWYPADCKKFASI